MSPFVGSNILAGASGQGDAGYKIERSLRFDRSASSYLNKAFSSAGNRRTFTVSFWTKRTSIGNAQNIFNTSSTPGQSSASSPRTEFRFSGNGTLKFAVNSSGSTWKALDTTAVFRDFGAWYHIVVSVDTTQATEANRVKLYVNGVQQALTGTYPALNEDLPYNNNYTHTIGNYANNYNDYFDGYLADFHFSDGQALAATDFGEYDDNNVWQPKKFTGSYNTDGYTVSGGPYYTSSTTWAEALNGSTTGRVMTYSTTSTTATFSPGISWSSQVRILGIQYGGGYARVNGGSDLTGFGTTASWVDVTSQVGSSGTLTSLTVGDVSTNYFALYAIELDGTILDVSAAGVNGFHLDFADNSSDAALGTDSSGNNNTWTVNNLKAVDAFGITSAASITSSQTISFPITYAATVTYEFFVKVTTAVTYTYFAEESTASVWNIGINSSGSLLFGNYTGGWTTFSSTGLNDGNWHFVRLTTTGSSTSLYIDGTLFGTNASGGGVATSYSQITNRIKDGAFKIAHLRITTGGTPPTTGIPAISSMNQAAGTGGTLAFYDALDDIASSGTKTSDGGNVTITMSAATAAVSQSGVDSLIDTPTNYQAGSGNNGGNYATLNPLVGKDTGNLRDGNLSQVTSSGWSRLFPTIMPKTGKWYIECLQTNYVYGTRVTNVGVAPVDNINITSATKPGNTTDEVAYETQFKRTLVSGTAGQTGFPTYVSDDIIGVAIDLDNRNVQFYLNNSAMGTATTFPSTTKDYTFIIGCTGSNAEAIVNFGARSFAYTPPAGFKSLCTQNLDDSTIEDGSKAFDILTWTGDGSGARTVSGLNLSDAPDFVWSKTRNHGYHNNVWDSVRGYGTSATALITDYLGSANGGTLNSATASSLTFSGGVWHNENAKTYVAWAFAGGDNYNSINTSTHIGGAWSSMLSTESGTYTVTNPHLAFDGSPGNTSSTRAQANRSSEGAIVFTPTGGYTVNSQIRVYGGSASDDCYLDFGSGYGSAIGLSSGGWTTVYTGSGTLTKMKFLDDGAGQVTGLGGIEIDGKLLVDGFIPAGGLNSSVYDQSQTWSNSLSASFRGSEPATNAFDGDTSTIAGSGGSITYTSPVAVASNSTIRVFVHGGDHNVSVNGGANQTVAAGSFVTLNFTNPTNSTFTITFDRVGTADTGVRAIEIGGKLLVDYGVSVANVPTIASTVRANPNYGFSISKADVDASLTGGPTVAHGLNAKPDFIIGKNIDSLSIYWRVFHKDLQENHYLGLNRRDAEQNSSAVWGDNNSLDSNVFQIGSGTPASMWIPSGTDTCIFYAWSEVKGYSKFGSYTGNGSNDGPFAFTGFTPKWIIFKNATTTGDEWMIYDSERKQFNAINNPLEADTADSENTSGYDIDILSNGFKVRTSSVRINGSGNKNIYAAFAEHPFKTARAR